MASSATQTPPHSLTVRVVEESPISPPEGTVPSEASFPLTFFDVIWVLLHPTQRLFFYPITSTRSVVEESLLPDLKRSLSLTLRHFYPLAGKLTRRPASDRLEIRCSASDSVTLTLAECCDGDYFHALVGDGPRAVGMFHPLLPHLPGAELTGEAGGRGTPVMSVQVTVFPGSGISVGLTVHHAVCDGGGFIRFVKAWASACSRLGAKAAAKATNEEHPLLDRSVIADPNRIYAVYWNDVQRLLVDGGGGEAWIDGRDDRRETVQSTFRLRRRQIQALKRRITAGRAADDGQHCSTFVATCAYVWICMLKAQQRVGGGGSHDDGSAYFTFAADLRSRLRQPVPQAYFGNCLGPAFAEVRVSDLLLDDGGLPVAAEAIERGIVGLEGGGDFVRDPEGLIAKILSWWEHAPLSIAGSPRFGVYGVDFGWGRPSKVEVVGIDRTGAISLADSGREEEEGGIEVGVALPRPAMDVFTSAFSEGLNNMVPIDDDDGQGQAGPGTR